MDDAEHFVVAEEGSGETENPDLQESLIVTLEGATSGSDSGRNDEEEEADPNMVPVQFVLEAEDEQQPPTETRQDGEAVLSEVTPVEAECVDEGSLQYEPTDGAETIGVGINSATVDSAEVDGAEINGEEVDGAGAGGAETEIDGANVTETEIDAADMSGEQKDSTTVESLLSAVPFPHQSILRSGNEIPVLDLSEEVFHCALCPESYPAWGSKEEAAEHFKTAHWHAKLVIDEDVNAALCSCTSHTCPHYHCPYCGGVQEGLQEMTQHVSSCIHTVLSQQQQEEEPPAAEPGADKPPDTSPTKTPALKQHKSLVSALTDVVVKVCRRCCRGARYHCPFCPDVLCKPQSLNKIKQHLLTNHWKFRVPYQDMFILKCTSACLGAVNGRPIGAHWHCPVCARLVSTRQVMRSHLNSHLRGTAQRRRTNAEWASLMGPEHANLLFSSKRQGGEQAVERLMNTALQGGHDQGFTAGDANAEQEEPKQVFQTVAALLTRDMLAAIPGSVSAYFSSLQDAADSSLQFSTSDQWCLLQADWHTMSTVHEQLTELLSHPAGGGTDQWVPSSGAGQQGGIPDVGAGGDGFIINQDMPDEPESGNTGTEDASILGDGDAAADILGGSGPYLHTDNQDVSSTPGETLFPEPTAVTATDAATRGKGYSILVAELQGLTAEANSVSVTEPGPEKGEEAVASPAEDTKPEDQTESSIPAGVTTETLDPQNEQTSAQIELTSIPIVPVKRGRGRPRKVPQPIEPIVIQPIEHVEMKREDSPELGTRRRRTKLPKRYQDYDTFSTDASEDVKHKPEAGVGPAAGSGPPVKRGRGRPPRQPKSLITSMDDADWTSTSGSNRTPIVKTPAHMVQQDAESSDVEETAVGKPGNTMGVSPSRKRQKVGASDPPAITIAIDETTGNVISVAVTGDDTATESDKMKTDQETNENQLPDDMDIEEMCSSNGISLVRPKKLVICESCNKNFPDHHRFYQHILGSSCVEKRMKRDKNFKLSLELDLVIREVEREVTEPKCPLCQREFKFILHAKMHYAEKTCMKTSRQDMGTLTKNEDTGLYHCSHCSFSHDGMRRVLEHEMRKHWKKTERCPICTKKYSCQSFLREHIKAVHAKGKERAVCDQCGVEVTARLLRQHIKLNHDPTYVKPKRKPITEPISCRDCDFKSMSYAKLVRHRANKHKEQDKQCPHCELRFAMTGDLNRHVRGVHLGQNQVSAECPQCGKTIAKKNMAAHIRMVHEKRRPHSCYLCGRAFLTKHTLRMHMGTHQPAEQKDTRYLCAFCGKGFSHKTHYQDHLNTHTGARPYTCEVCNKTFRCNPALHKHKELHRTINLHCDLCSLHFPNRKALRIHNNKEHLPSSDTATSVCRCVCDAEYNSPQTLAQHQAVCGQWQQAHPHLQATSHVQLQQPVSSSLQDQMAVLLQQAAAGGDADQGTYIVLEGQEGEETVMVLQSIDSVDGSVIQTVSGTDIMAVSQASQPDAADGDGDGTEVLLSAEEALTMAASQTDMALTMETDNPDGGDSGLLTLEQGVVDQQLVSQEEEEGDLNRYLCGYCQKLFTSLDDVQTHMVAEHVAAEGGEVELALHNPADDAVTGLDEGTEDNLL